MAAMEAALRQDELEQDAGPLRTFRAGLSDDVALELYQDRVEIRTSRRVLTVWHRDIERCLASRDSGWDVLAIVDRSGQVLLVPMQRSDAGVAAELLDRLVG